MESNIIIYAAPHSHTKWARLCIALWHTTITHMVDSSFCTATLIKIFKIQTSCMDGVDWRKFPLDVLGFKNLILLEDLLILCKSQLKHSVDSNIWQFYKVIILPSSHILLYIVPNSDQKKERGFQIIVFDRAQFSWFYGEVHFFHCTKNCKKFQPLIPLLLWISINQFIQEINTHGKLAFMGTLWNNGWNIYHCKLNASQVRRNMNPWIALAKKCKIENIQAMRNIYPWIY